MAGLCDDLIKRLAIVPARKGSKRFPGKNKALLSGIPLVQHTLDIASDCFTEVCFTTDDTALLKDIEQYHVYDNVVCKLRPTALATDTSKVIETVKWIFYSQWNDWNEIWLLLPTCPLRIKQDVIDAQYKLVKDRCDGGVLKDHGYIDGIVSVTDYEFPPQLALRCDKAYFLYDKAQWEQGNSRSQDHEKRYRPNGALYGMRWESFGLYRNFYGGRTRAHYMPRERSVDIDTKLDLLVAESLLGND
jgi:CMP-N-acetylneuraminic acid synthetase